MTTPKTFIAYCRQSQGRQGETEETSLSLSSQSERIRSYAAREGWLLIDEIRDHDLSGEKWDRDGLQRLIARVKQGGIDGVIVFALNRLSRKVGHLFYLVDVLQEHHVELVSVTEAGIDNVLIRAVHSGMAEHFNDQLRKTIRSNLLTRANQGKHHGRAPFGYINAGDRLTGKRLEIVPSEAEVVQRIYRMRADGIGVPTITETLNREGILTKQGAAWHHNSVRVVLKTATYAGFSVYQGKVIGDLAPGVAEPIIDRPLWHQVQRSFNGARAVRAKPLSSWIEGLIKHVCGGGMGLQRSHQTRAIFRCNRFSNSHAFRCRLTPNTIAQAGLEAAVEACLLTDLTIRPRDPMDLLAARARELGQPNAVKRRSQLITQKTKLQESLDRAEKLVTEVGIRDGVWLKDYEAKTRPKLAEVERELTALSALPTEKEVTEKLALMDAVLGPFESHVSLPLSEPRMRDTLAKLGHAVFADGIVSICYAPEYRLLIPSPTRVRAVFVRGRGREPHTWRIDRVDESV